MYRPNDCSNTVGFCNREDVRAARSEKESRTHELKDRKEQAIVMGSLRQTVHGTQ